MPLYRLNEVVRCLRASKEAVAHLSEAAGCDPETYERSLKAAHTCLQVAYDNITYARRGPTAPGPAEVVP